MSDVSIIIPVKNEILHIERSIKSALKITSNVFVVDSDSNDGTAELAREMGVEVFNYSWNNISTFASKMNWALANLPIETTWIIRLDADEFFLEENLSTIRQKLCSLSQYYDAYTVKRRVHFNGSWIRYGGQYSTPTIRIFKNGKCFYENRLLDEHIQIEGKKTKNLNIDIVDDNLNSLSKWLDKHDKYALLEACQYLVTSNTLKGEEFSNFRIATNNMKRKDKSFYYKLPIYWRCFFYFCYRYFILFGFLDGRNGFLWHFLHAFWYRVIVDAKISDFKLHFNNDYGTFKEYIFENYDRRINL